MVDYSWPEAKDRKLIGQRITRLDGPAKASGSAKYTYDLKPQGMLWAKCCAARTPTPASSRSTSRPPRRCPASRRCA